MRIENPLDNLQKPKILPEAAALDKDIEETISDPHENDTKYQEERNEFSAALSKYEVPLREDQAALLKIVAKNVEDILEKHRVFVNTEEIFSHVHVVVPEFYKELYGNKNAAADGNYMSHLGEITLGWAGFETQSVFAMKSAHEILHYFQDHNRKRGEEKISSNESPLGLMIKRGDEILLINMLEAVTQKLAVEVTKNIKDPGVSGEYETLKKEFNKDPDKYYILAARVLSGDYKLKPARISNAKHLQNLDKMLQEIYEKNKDEFKNTDEVFEVFVDAAYSGKKLPMARLIEKTYGTQSVIIKKFRKIFGKKSAFRDVAEKWSK